MNVEGFFIFVIRATGTDTCIRVSAVVLKPMTFQCFDKFETAFLLLYQSNFSYC